MLCSTLSNINVYVDNMHIVVLTIIITDNLIKPVGNVKYIIQVINNGSNEATKQCLTTLVINSKLVNSFT